MSSFAKTDLFELIERTRAQDCEAKRELFQRVHARMKSFFNRRLKPNDVSDMAQDTIVVVLNHLADFRGTTESEFWKWIHVVARSVCLSAARAANTQKRGGATHPLEEDSRGGVRVPDPEPTPSAIVARREQSAAVRAALAQLTLKEQRVILLRNDEEREWPEIAKMVGSNVEAVRKFYRRAVQKWSAICQENR